MAVLSAEQKPLQSATSESVPSGGCRALQQVCASERRRVADASMKSGVASALADDDAIVVETRRSVGLRRLDYAARDDGGANANALTA